MKSGLFLAFATMAFFAINTADAQLSKTMSLNTDSHKADTIAASEDYTTTILVDESPAKAFSAIMDMKAWWSEQIEGETDQLNATFLYHYKDVHLCKIKLIEKVTDKKLVYQIVDNKFSFTKDQQEWIDTKLIFDISNEGAQTKILFTHKGLVPGYECYEICRDAWSNYIQGSLYSLIMTGKGLPNPKDGEGFNAELVEKWKLSTGHK
jgi:hypothetical protein